MVILSTKSEVLDAIKRLKGLSEPKAHNNLIKVDYDYQCGCGMKHNTKDASINYMAIALPVRHLFECPNGYVTCIKQGMFSCKGEFTYRKDLNT